MSTYKEKYLKYKLKYTSLKNNSMFGGGDLPVIDIDENDVISKIVESYSNKQQNFERAQVTYQFRADLSATRTRANHTSQNRLSLQAVGCTQILATGGPKSWQESCRLCSDISKRWRRARQGEKQRERGKGGKERRAQQGERKRKGG